MLYSLSDTQKMAEKLASILRCGDVVTLAGDLGAGKTTFAQFLIRALAGNEMEVTSPTFTLLQTYPVTLADGARSELYHYDLYRIEHVSALAELGLDDAFEHLTVIEWPERMGKQLPALAFRLEFRLDASGIRHVCLHAPDGRWSDI